MYRVVILVTENPQEAKSAYPVKPAALRLIRVDTLRRVHNVGFLAGRLFMIVCLVFYAAFNIISWRFLANLPDLLIHVS